MNKTINYLEKLLTKNDTVILSCSAGPDSMCLYDILLKLKKDINFKLVCVHINHTRRKASDKEANFLKEYSKNNKVPFEFEVLTEFNSNFQQDARKKRYDFLNKIKEKYNGTYIMTAHHGDDLVETILMRITRGSNLSGYAGFMVKNNNYIKPLIFHSKEKIIKYNKTNNVVYMVDKSNKSLKYTRNRYRIKILKQLKKENADVNEKYLKFSEELLNYNNYIREEIENKKIIQNKTINLDLFNQEVEFIKTKTIEYLIDLYQQDYTLEVSDNIVKEIIKLINSEKGKARIDLPNKMVGIKDNKVFYIKKDI